MDGRRTHTVIRVESDEDGVEIRAARPEEADEVLRVLCAAFGLSFDAARPIYYQDPYYLLSHKRLLRTPAHGIVSCLTVIPTQIRVGAAWVPMGGIAGMATRPDRQGQGWGSRLLAATVPAISAEMGYPLSGLFPAEEKFYRRIGWETASRATRWHGRPGDLSTVKGIEFVRPLDLSHSGDRAAVRALYQKADWTGACARDDRRWRIIGTPLLPREWIVYQVPGERIKGYGIYEESIVDDKRGLHLLELHGATPEARDTLMAFLAERATQCHTLEWTTSEAEVKAFGLGERGLDQETGMMLRLTDLTAALEAIHPANLAPVLAIGWRSLTVQASDTLLPQNERPVRLTPAGIRSGADTDTDWIAADIRSLAQIYFGYCTPTEAHRQGCLRASSPEALRLADELFPARSPFVAPLDKF